MAESFNELDVQHVSKRSGLRFEMERWLEARSGLNGGTLVRCHSTCSDNLRGHRRLVPSMGCSLVLGLLHVPFLRGGRCWCVRGAHPVRKSVPREFGLVLGHGQVISNDQVNDDFALALELGGFGREVLALIQCGLDLVTDRDQSLERYLR